MDKKNAAGFGENAAWLRTKNQGHTHTGMMAIPVELSLVEKEDNVKLRLQPIQEIETCRSNSAQLCEQGQRMVGLTNWNAKQPHPYATDGVFSSSIKDWKIYIDFH